MNTQNVVFVGGVKACFTQQDIGDYFSQFGEIASIKMKKSRKKKTINRGFCLIKFSKVRSARRVIEIKNHSILGRLVTCREYLKGEQLKQGKRNKNDKKIYISGLPKQTSNFDIITAFSIFGEVESGYTLKEQSTGMSKGFGFVTFVTKQAADKALSSSNKVEIFGKKIDVAQFSSSGFPAFEQTENLSSRVSQHNLTPSPSKYPTSLKPSFQFQPQVNFDPMTPLTKLISFEHLKNNKGTDFLSDLQPPVPNYGVWSKPIQDRDEQTHPFYHLENSISLTKQNNASVKELTSIDHGIKPNSSTYFKLPRYIYSDNAHNLQFNKQ